jgi:hypothetical protein
VVSHEIGHNFGARHTHCYPAPPAAPADTCYSGQSGCYVGPTSCPAATTINGVPNVRGTIMSYCHLLAGCGVSPVFHPRSVDQITPLATAAAGVCLSPVGPAAPSVSAVSPGSGSDSGGQTITITGGGFANGAAVSLVDGASSVAATSVNVVSAGTITAVTPAHAPGAVDVVVTNPDQQTATLRNGYAYLGFPSISIDDRAAPEGGVANAAFRVFLSRADPGTITVDYATSDVTASAGLDYTATSGTLTFTPGRVFQSVSVPILADAVAEGTETFTVTLSNPAGALLARAQAIGTIEPPPAAAVVPMYRAYNFTADYHFFTTSLAEKANAVANGYRDESTPLPFSVRNTQVAGTTPLFRMYNPNSGRHYYTAGAGERDSLRTIGWIYEKDEGFIYTALQTGTAEVFRLYNNNSGVHLYTASAGEKNAVLATFPGIWVQHQSLGWAVP